MTKPMRRDHLRLWIALAILLPVLFAAALGARDAEIDDRVFLWEQFR